MQRLKVFISSPSDVEKERYQALLAISKLARDYERYFAVEFFMSDDEPQLANKGHFQDAIELPSSADVVLVILRGRLGTDLPARTPLREYRGLDGHTLVTGTEWEFEEALNGAKNNNGVPDLLVYRWDGDPGTSLADKKRREEEERQWNFLENFWQRYFEKVTEKGASSSRHTRVTRRFPSSTPGSKRTSPR